MPDSRARESSQPHWDVRTPEGVVTGLTTLTIIAGLREGWLHTDDLVRATTVRENAGDEDWRLMHDALDVFEVHALVDAPRAFAHYYADIGASVSLCGLLLATAYSLYDDQPALSVVTAIAVTYLVATQFLPRTPLSSSAGWFTGLVLWGYAISPTFTNQLLDISSLDPKLQQFVSLAVGVAVFGLVYWIGHSVGSLAGSAVGRARRDRYKLPERRVPVPAAALKSV